jgi:hypothetical protein
MSTSLHLVKLCVGADGVSDLIDWQAARIEEARVAGREPLPRHVTRMWPKREAELVDGGSIYWVFKGLILARQRILSLSRTQGADGIQRCAIALDPALVRVQPRPRRPFQGWRYLPADEAPADIPDDGGPELPTPLAFELAQIGVL